MKGFVFRVIPPRPDFASTMNDYERATMTSHFCYWSGLAAQGKALAFGPADDPNGVYGIGIVLAEDHTEAMALRDGDPAALIVARISYRDRTDVELGHAHAAP